MGQYFTKTAFKKIAKVVFEEVVFPAARDYVQKTDNKYDDAALQFLKEFVDEALGPEAVVVSERA